MSGVPYLKMNGLGNDFVVLDARDKPLLLTDDKVRWISDREQGIGCDQLIVLGQPRSDDADVFMKIYNAEGGEVGACGNATRCIAALMADETGKSDVTVETVAGLLKSKVDGDTVTVDFGLPKFGWDQIPLAEEFADTSGIELQIGPIDAPVLHTPACVNMGNPHAVFWVDKDPESYDLHRFGPLLENHPIFPERANISIAQVLDDNHIRVRVWERGVGETSACGTAACAVGVSAARKGLTGRDTIIELRGGNLAISWRESDGHVLKTGPWMLDAEGELPSELFEAAVA